MKLEGIHHVTAICADAPRNVRFYAGTLGLRLVKRTVNQDDPTVYHLFYADEEGSAGADITFFEYPGTPRGSAGEGMVHTVFWRVGSPGSLDFWGERLEREGFTAERSGDVLSFHDPEGLRHELVVYDGGERPLVARAPDVPIEHALQGFHGVRAYASDPERSRPLLEEHLAFQPSGPHQWLVAGEERSGFYAYDEPPDTPPVPGAGTVHHVAFASRPEDHGRWRERALGGGAAVTPIIDRHYFRSIYFREPSGVLFEIATLGPGFAVDEPPERLGERLSLPPRFEPLRERLERTLKPLPDPRAERTAKTRS